MPNITRRDRGILGTLAIAFTTTVGAALFAQTAPPPTANPDIYVHPDLRKAADAARQGRFLMPAPPPPGGPGAVQRTVPGPKGAPDVKVTIVNGRRRSDHVLVQPSCIFMAAAIREAVPRS